MNDFGSNMMKKFNRKRYRHTHFFEAAFIHINPHTLYNKISTNDLKFKDLLNMTKSELVRLYSELDVKRASDALYKIRKARYCD
jgi:hypothetical protein